MNHIKHAIIASSAFAALASAFADPVTQYLWWSAKDAPVWKNADGDTVTWTNGNDAVWKSVPSDNATPSFNLTMNSLTLDTSTYRSGFWLDGGTYRIGAGGVTFAQRASIPVGAYGGTRRVVLTASQEWKGTQSGSYSHFMIGYPGSYWSCREYWSMKLEVNNGVEWWKISGLLNVWIGGKNDQLGNVDVTVESPARLMLVSRHTVSGAVRYGDARLAAKKLILKGDGYPLVTSTLAFPNGHASDLYGVNTLDAAHLAPVLELADGADLALANGVFAIPDVRVSGTGESHVTGIITNNLATTAVTFSDGATLYLDASIYDGAAGSSAINATGSGTLKINTKKYSATGAISLGADITMCLVGDGGVTFPFSGGAAIELDIGTGVTNCLSDAALAGYVGRPVKVTSGTLIVQSHDSMAIPGLNLSADGGEIVYASDCPLIVTDAARQEASITVGAGEELLVFGNGLTSATALSLTGGTVKFMRTATIASPISVSGAVSQIATWTNGICGTIAGAVTAAKDIKIAGPGRMEFTAGATFSGDTSLNAYDGEVELRSGNYAFGSSGFILVGTATTAATGNSWVGTWCRKFVVGDGANVTFTAHNTSASVAHIKVHPLPDGAGYKRESVFEIATNGTVTLPNTSDISLGNNQNIGTLHINGGTLSLGEYGRIFLGNGGWATGYLKMDAGTLRLGGYITRSVVSGMGYVIWNGGTIRVDQTWIDGRACLIYPTGDGIPGKRNTMRVSVNVAGEDCVLDLTGCRFASMTNMASQYNGMFNEWWGRGQLTVKGGKNFVMTSIPDGLRLRLEGDGTTVTFPCDGKVYDYDTCLVNCQWRDPYRAPTYNVTNSWLSSMTFANVTFAGTNCSFVCEREATPVYATNVTVTASGVSGVIDGLPADTTLKDVSFESGATWKIGATTLDIAGRLAFGDCLKALISPVPPFGTTQKVARAADGFADAPTAVEMRPRSYRLRLDAATGEAYIYPAGFSMTLR